ncbi:RNA-directed DNA polymerase [Sulfitobacter pseudonitzschiae]|uniref:RNA-directed DNA polymerase n=1 Tax=Pseudosulfitobacter pseudonitzschiae TaxID=1402135 RepID=A0A9Q2NNJ2_9RHOB|nr:RNA-directed DNA polymerase [Pseudosulfitobacter pseudonitzschiae]MBM2295122.1 RNA-directed DNA polymerase [Pseudosulfitobacter pseudonitzschiae]MBM2300043.1 RNA-directed DNA polymerase [Pseudosulfitobacter pseudonitzschiae]MBM2304959.1 RNA-directed DNA polymerase [Pseudosulfitobacter pseudonitzschiae]MBM2314733.1 RNA-directed DNA polymerase [Pseudosulfitobacter pseudonitzschiae]MBM2319639.1 RNA-directed DNA polymerase [Pseudosulfitobacter pseudonitzschiae]
MSDEKTKADPIRIIDLDSSVAKAALLKSESYFDFDLPPYFDFSPLLKGIDAKLAGAPLKDVWASNPADHDGVNHIIFHSKDGKYAWRPQELIHPFIYVALVDQLTNPPAWSAIKIHFASCAANPNIECVSHPLVSNSKQTDKAAQVTSWWLEMEQRSLELSLEYEHVIHTDIADCYGSIYTHTICWALHGKPLAKSREGRQDKNLLGNILDRLLTASRHGETNGIPQGSTLTNLIAEMVLGYADTRLTSAMLGEGITDYKILRYRDDYRIFTKNPAHGERITKLLAEVLRDLGMKLSPDKTAVSNEIIRAAIKEDKLFWIGKEKRKRSLIKHMLLIHELAGMHPNSGSVSVAMSKFQRRLTKLNEKGFKDPVRPIIAVATDIALHNPRIYPVYAAILSGLLHHLSPIERQQVVEAILRKFEKVPNCGHLHVWMQRFAVPMGIPLLLSEPICKALDDSEFQLWAADWLPDAYRPLLRAGLYVDQGLLNGLKPVIEPEEVQLFGYDY